MSGSFDDMVLDEESLFPLETNDLVTHDNLVAHTDDVPGTACDQLDVVKEGDSSLAIDHKNDLIASLE